MRTHVELKHDYITYREKARELYQTDDVKVSLNANVQMTEDGAFVEAMVWVPRERLEVLNVPE